MCNQCYQSLSVIKSNLNHLWTSFTVLTDHLLTCKLHVNESTIVYATVVIFYCKRIIRFRHLYKTTMSAVTSSYYACTKQSWKAIRRICGFNLRHNKKNTEVGELLRLHTFSLSFNRSRLWWFWHMECKSGADWLVYEDGVWGTRKRGHPRKTGWDCIKRDIGMSHVDRDHLRLKINREFSWPRFNWKTAIKTMSAYVYVRILQCRLYMTIWHLTSIP